MSRLLSRRPLTALTLAAGLLGPLAAAAVAPSAVAQVVPFPPTFQTREIETNGTTLHVRVGGHGPAVLLLHGYGETGDMWGAMATDLARDHT